jgi:hypothetical protein
MSITYLKEASRTAETGQKDVRTTVQSMRCFSSRSFRASRFGYPACPDGPDRAGICTNQTEIFP